MRTGTVAWFLLLTACSQLGLATRRVTLDERALEEEEEQAPAPAGGHLAVPRAREQWRDEGGLAPPPSRPPGPAALPAAASLAQSAAPGVAPEASVPPWVWVLLLVVLLLAVACGAAYCATRNELFAEYMLCLLGNRAVAGESHADGGGTAEAAARKEAPPPPPPASPGCKGEAPGAAAAGQPSPPPPPPAQAPTAAALPADPQPASSAQAADPCSPGSAHLDGALRASPQEPAQAPEEAEAPEEAHMAGSPSARAPLELVFPLYCPAEARTVADACFDHDWRFLSGSSVFASEADAAQVQDVIRQHYGWLISLYRRLSTQAARVTRMQDGLSCFGVGPRTALKLLDSDKHDGIDVLDKSNLTKAKAEFLYKSALRWAGPEKGKVLIHHESGLVRHQFTEFLLRVAQAKYPKEDLGKAVETLLQALSQLCNKYSGDVRGLFETGSAEVVARIFAKHRPMLQMIFVKFTDNQVTMTIEQWQRFLTATNVYTMFPGFKQDYAAYAFRLGVNTVADEQYSHAFQQMSFPEFQRSVTAVLFLSEVRTTGSCSAERLVEHLGTFFDRDLYMMRTALPAATGSAAPVALTARLRRGKTTTVVAAPAASAAAAAPGAPKEEAEAAVGTASEGGAAVGGKGQRARRQATT